MAASLIQAWTRVEGYMRDFLTGLRDEDLARGITFALGGGPQQTIPLGDLMQHGAIHAGDRGSNPGR